VTDILQTTADNLTIDEAAEIFDQWFDEFVAALEHRSEYDLAQLFTEDATWRDFMAFPWDFHNTIGRAATVSTLLEMASSWRAGDWEQSQEQPPKPWGGGITCFFEFTTSDRVDRGYVMLVQGPERFLASTIQTQITRLAACNERLGDYRRDGKVYGIVPNRTRWTDDRRRAAAFEGYDPPVVVLGAGHNGLSVAARLGALDVPTLVIEREARIGDTWRKRYASLALHSTVWGDHMPYLPFPPTWTAHTPKDKLAEWLELYAVALDLNVWTSSTFIGGRYDEATERWTLHVRREDGSIRVLQPRHFIVAGGMFAGPKIPAIMGLDTFSGVWAHSDSFQDGARYCGKRALIVGAGVSGHELAHDLWEHGADVTLLQRSATYVISFEAQHRFWNPLFVEHMAYTPEFADQIQYAVPFERTDPINKRLVKLAAEYDSELLARLQAVGFKLEWGPDGTGILGAHMSGVDGYQINIGASELVADRSIHLKQGVEVAEIRGGTVSFTDGSEMRDVDLILFATGYHQFWGHIKPMLGVAAQKVDKAYGRAADGEYANVWRRSDQPGLWFATGFLRMTRFYSQFTALLIKAIEMGIEPIDPGRAGARL
jgi:cation diffusion facilitator CzcD-associated flavoprotein CzcO